MIWLTWRQLRIQAAVVIAAAASAIIVLAATGPRLASLYRTSAADFINQIQFSRADHNVYIFGVILVYVAPAIMGAFWGAPLIARELETGTHRLVWTQSVSRRSWLAGKMGLAGLTALVVSGLLSLALSWWSSPIDRALNHGQGAGPFSLPRLSPVIFGARGIVPIGYTAFAFAAGVAIGLVVKRSLPALAVTLTLVAAAQIVMPTVVRAHLIAPERINVTISASSLKGLMIHGDPEHGPIGPVKLTVHSTAGPGSWALSNETINAEGTVVKNLPSWVLDCGGPRVPKAQASPVANGFASQKACFTRLANEGYRQQVTFVPAGRFWALQWRETGLLFLAALLLVGFCFWRIDRDLS
jgi:hypothetical protein